METGRRLILASEVPAGRAEGGDSLLLVALLEDIVWTPYGVLLFLDLE